MAESSAFQRYLEAGMAFTDMTRQRAEAIVKDLVKAGDLPRKRAEEAIEELLTRSRQNTEAVMALVQAQIQEQLSNLGLATKADIARLEAKINAKPGGTSKAPAAKKAPAKKAPAKKAAASA
jgi:polyhydroxyalkanoate synthesis regulator phasin